MKLKTLLIPALFILLISNTAIALNVTTVNEATKYREHGATIDTSTLTADEEIRIWIEDYDNMPIENIYEYTNKETGEPVYYQTKEDTISIVWEINGKYQVDQDYSLHVTTSNETAVEEFTVTGTKQPDVIGDFVITLANNTWIIMSIIGMILLSFIILLVYKYTVGYL